MTENFSCEEDGDLGASGSGVDSGGDSVSPPSSSPNSVSPPVPPVLGGLRSHSVPQPVKLNVAR
eukprot:2627926-Rhodomonas_salina.2